MDRTFHDLVDEHAGRLLTVGGAAKSLDDLDAQEREAAARRAAEAAVAPLVWHAQLGDGLDTSELIAWLGITRQSLHRRMSRGTLLGVPGRGTTRFPIWQFDLEKRAVRDVVHRIISVWSAHVEVDPVDIASWARTPQRELGSRSPAAVIVEGRGDHDEDAVVVAAGHAAATLAW